VAGEAFRGSIYIEAEPALVFEYFTHPAAIASWMGDRAVVDPRPGGEFIVFFEDRAVEGRYIALEPPHRLVISWGRAGSQEFPPGSSTLEVELKREASGTRVEVIHSGLPESETPRHALGWQHYLARLSAVAAGHAVPAHRTPKALTQGVD
jgi:uncharacterized protein YndB with AHSA1/START domain